MSAGEGYGRGYYGSGQLEQKQQPKRTSWFKVVAVVGVGGAVAWFLWPRKPPPDLSAYFPSDPKPSPPVETVASTTQAMAVQGSSTLGPLVPLGAFQKQLEDDARARGYVLVKDYEDSVVASARQLQAAGAKIILEPHLQHLAPRLQTDEKPK